MFIDFKYRGIQATQEHIDSINNIILNNTGISRWSLSRIFCKEWNWIQPNGSLRDMVCRGFMLSLHRAGYIKLPEKKSNPKNPFVNRKRPLKIKINKCIINKPITEISDIRFELVKYNLKEKLFNSLIEYHHYLGYCHPVGENMKYLCYIKDRPIACFVWSSAVRHLKPRDQFVGWSGQKRQKNICYIAYNSRFLILPWIKINNLASKLLGLMAKRLSTDWQKLYNHPIYLLETFVDTEKFKGTCYRASNWKYAGLTTGRGKNDNTHKQNRSLKAIYLYPLCKDFQEKMQND